MNTFVRRSVEAAISAALACTVGCGGTGSGPSAKASKPKEPASLTCPVLRGSAARDVAEMFGIEIPLAGRISRTMALLGELERSAKALDEESRAVCTALAKDLDTGTPSKLTGASHPCELAVERASALRAALGSASLSVSVSDVSCGVPKDRLAKCAGECITGREDVVSAVECAGLVSSQATAATDAAPANADGGATCNLDFRLPEANPACVTQCGARALRDVACTASIDVRLGEGESVVLSRERVEALRRDLPRLVALGASLPPRVATVVDQVHTIIDDLAQSVDGLSHEDAVAAEHAAVDKPLVDRRVVIGAVLAGCVAPAFADTLRAGSALQGSLTGAVQLHAALLR